MIKLGKLTDYAVVAMARLSREDGACSAHALSGMTGVPEPTVAKIMKTLARHGLVESVRGAAGGYRLARAADEISVSDIITVMEGPVAIVSCIEDSGEECRTSSSCLVKGRWTKANDAIRAALESVTLAEMAAPQAPRPVTVTMPRQVRA